MNTQKQILAITALFLVASLLISCGRSASETTPPIRFVTVTPLPLITPPTESPPTSTAAIIAAPTTKQPPTGVTLNEQTTASPTSVTVTTCAPPAGWVSYTVQVNDTLGLLANRTNITVEQIKQANCLNDDLIFAGQTLHLPFIPPPPPTATLPPPTSTVQSTATFTAIPIPTVTTATMIPSRTPTVELPPTATATPTPTVEKPVAVTPTVEKPVAVGPGVPTLLIKPFSGPIGTQYTITLSGFVPNETVKVEFFLRPKFDLVLTDSTSVDNTGIGIFQFVSKPEHPTGMYAVRATGNSRPDKQAFGNFQVGE